MAALAVAGNPAFAVSDLEVRRNGPSYTCETVREIREAAGPDARLFLILGGDALAELPRWRHVAEILRQANVIAVARPGHPLGELAELDAHLAKAAVERIRTLAVDFPQIDVSATMIRERVQAGRSIRYLVPEPVRHYILRAGLYLQP
jgi:nicotinate-nucleotide adenylyltransferase